MSKPLKRAANKLCHYNANGDWVAGPNPNMVGDCTGLRGNCTELRGDCTGLHGDLDKIPGCARPCDISKWAEVGNE